MTTDKTYATYQEASAAAAARQATRRAGLGRIARARIGCRASYAAPYVVVDVDVSETAARLAMCVGAPLEDTDPFDVE